MKPINIALAIEECRIGKKRKINQILQKYAELKAATNCNRDTVLRCRDQHVKSTFLITFSPDRSRIASSHGDHTIKVFEVKTGRLLNTLQGHPRTPWCVTFHPYLNNIIASGCLSGQIRIWDLYTGDCQVHNITDGSVIASLAFHPIDDILAVVSYSKLFLLNWKTGDILHQLNTSDRHEYIRIVKFDPFGSWMITGILNREHMNNRPGVWNIPLRRNQEASDNRETPVSTTSATRERALWRSGLDSLSTTSGSAAINIDREVAAEDNESVNTETAGERTVNDETRSDSSLTSSDCSTGSESSEGPSSGASEARGELVNSHLNTSRTNMDSYTDDHSSARSSVSEGERVEGTNSTNQQTSISRSPRSQLFYRNLNVSDTDATRSQPTLRQQSDTYADTSDDIEISIETSTDAPGSTFRSSYSRRSSFSISSLNQDSHTVAAATARTPQHVHTALVISRRSESDSEISLRTAINRAIAGAFAGNGEGAVAANILNTTYRLQIWDLVNAELPDLTNDAKNIIVPSCKLHNDGSLDISEDGSLLATFVPSPNGFPELGKVCVFSLQKETFGQCLFRREFGPNAISLSFSPLNGYLLVGLAARRISIAPETEQVMGQVFKLPDNGEKVEKFTEDKVTFSVIHPHSRMCSAPISINTMKFHPEPGVGIFYGTNQGALRHCRVGNRISSKEEDIW